MSVQQPATSGANTTTSGVDATNSVTDQSTTEATSGAEARDTVIDKLKREKNNYAASNAEIRKELDEMKRLHAESQESELQSKEQYKELWEQSKEELQKVKGEHESLNLKITEGKKMSAVKEELRKRGLNPHNEVHALKLMDVSQVLIDPETGTVVGAEDAAKDLHEQLKDSGFFGQAVPGVSHQAATVNKPSGKPLSEWSQDEIRAALKRG